MSEQPTDKEPFFRRDDYIRLVFAAMAASLSIVATCASCGRREGSTAPPAAPMATSSAVPSSASAPKEVLAWVLPYTQSMASLEKTADLFTVVSPTYFKVAVDGKQSKLEDWDSNVPFPRDALDKVMQGKTAAVIPLVGCLEPCATKISPLLDDGAARSAHIKMLIEAARSQKLGGLFIDYEEIRCRTESFTSMVQDLGQGLHAEGRKLGIVVTEPCGGGPGCQRTPYAFDMAEIAKVADWMAVMEYDYDVEGKAPIAPKAWVQLGLDKVRKDVAPEHRAKVLVGTALYGRVTRGVLPDTAILWSDTRAGTAFNVPFTVTDVKYDAEAIAQTAKVESELTEKKKKKKVSGNAYFEDQETVATRLELYDSAGFSGVAFWRLGGEDPCVWESVRAWKGSTRPLPRACSKKRPASDPRPTGSREVGKP